MQLSKQSRSFAPTWGAQTLFGGKVEETVKQAVQHAQDRHQTLARKREETDEAPSSSTGRGFARFLGTVFALGSAALAGYGGIQVAQFHQNQPTAAQAPVEQQMKVYDQSVGKAYRELEKWLQQTQKDTKTYHFGTQSQMAFQEHAKKFVDSFITVLQQSTDPADQALANKLTLGGQDAEAHIDQLGTALYDYVQGRKANNESLNLMAFVEKEPSFSHLSAREKESFAQDLYRLFDENSTLKMENFQFKAVSENRTGNNTSPTPERTLRDILDAYVGNPIQGLSLERFKNVQGDEEANALFGQLVGQNFQHLSLADQALFQQKSQTMLKVLKYEFHPGFWQAMLAYGMAAAGGAGALGMSVVAARRVKQALKGRDPKDVSLTLVRDYDSRSQVRTLQENIKAQCVEIVEQRQLAAKYFPEVAEFMAELGFSKGSLSSQADKLQTFYANRLHERLLGKVKGRQLKAVDFYTQLHTLVNGVDQTKNYLPECDWALPAEAGKPLIKGVKLNSRDDLQTVREQLLKEQLQATATLLNHLIASAKTQEEALIHAQSVSALKNSEGEEAETDPSGALQIALKRLEQLQLSVHDDDVLAQTYRNYLSGLNKRLLQCEIALVEPTDGASLQQKLARLQEAENAARTLENQPAFEDLDIRTREARTRLQVVQDVLNTQRQADDAMK